MAKHVVVLNGNEERKIKELLKKGKGLSRDYLRAQILLMSHDGETREKIAQRLKCSYSHVYNIIRKYCAKGLEATITDEKREGRPPKLQQKQGAHLMALACSDPPQGRQCWTMQLLADKCIELTLVEFISDETVRRFLKKSKSNRGRQKVGASPP